MLNAFTAITITIDPNPLLRYEQHHHHRLLESHLMCKIISLQADIQSMAVALRSAITVKDNWGIPSTKESLE